MIEQGQVVASQFIRKLFNEYNNRNIKYCVLRGYESLPLYVSNDIDIFIEKNQFDIAQYILLNMSFKYDIIHLSSNFGLKKYILFISKKYILTIDFFYNISWKGFFFADSNSIINNTKIYNDIFVSKEGSEVAIVVMKELLMFGKIKSKNNAKKRIYYCLVNDEKTFDQVLEPYLGTMIEFIKHNIYIKNWKNIEQCTNKIRFQVIRQNIKIKGMFSLLNFLTWALKRTIERLRSKRGFFAAIIGPDGSGKTTLVNAVNKELDGTLFTKTNHFSSNFEILPLLSTVSDFLKGKGNRNKIRNIDSFKGFHSGMKQEANTPLRSFIYILYYSMDLIFGRITLLRKKSRGELIFFARYFYDYYYQLVNQNAPKWFINFMHGFIPKPDIVFYLDRDSNSIYALKPELSPGEIERQQNIILALAEKYDHFVKVDGNMGVERSKDQIIDAISTLLAQRIKK